VKDIAIAGIHRGPCIPIPVHTLPLTAWSWHAFLVVYKHNR